MDQAKVILVILIHRILKLLPDGLLLDVTIFATPLMQHLFPDVKRKLVKNHAVAFAEVDELERQKISKRAVSSYFQSKVFDFKYGFADSSGIDVSLDFPELKTLAQKFRDTAVICVVPHLRMTLLAAKLIAKYSGKRVIVPVRCSQQTSEFEKKMLMKMSDKNIEFVRSGNAMVRMVKAIEDKAVILLGFDVVDSVKYTQAVKFFGRQVPLPSGPAWLAKQYNLPLMTACAKVQDDPFRVKICVSAEISRRKNNLAMLQAVTRNLEEYIKENPGEWCIPDDYFETKYGSLKTKN